MSKAHEIPGLSRGARIAAIAALILASAVFSFTIAPYALAIFLVLE